MIYFRTYEHGLNNYKWSYLFIIPMIGHNLHFYVDAFIWKFSNPYIAAARGYVDEIILPSETREKIVSSLRVLRNKNLKNPWKKHDNIPL